MTISPITSTGDVLALSKVNQTISTVNSLDVNVAALESEMGSFTAGLIAEEAARVTGDAALAKADTDLEQKLKDQISVLPIPDTLFSRPGDAIEHYVDTLTGFDPTEPLPLDPNLIKSDDAGMVVRLTGDAILATRVYYPLEPGRKYLVEYAVQRRVNTPDPESDAIRLGLAWYDQNRIYLGQTVVEDKLGATTGSGRLTGDAVVARAAGTGIDIVSHANARYARPFVQTYGTLVQNDVEIMRWEDVTNVTAYSPDLSTVNGRLSALEAIDAGDRLDVLEAEVTSPNTLRLNTIGDLLAATVPVSVDVVEIQGYSAPGDGGAQLLVRSGSPAEYQSADSAWWEKGYGFPLRIEQFGGVADGVLNANGQRTSGTDNATPLSDMIAMMAARGVDGHLGPGIYYSSAQTTNDSGHVLHGAGMYSTTLHVKTNQDDEVGLLIPYGTSGCGIKDMTVSFEPTVSKVVNEGQYHAVIGIGGVYYFADTPDPLTDFLVENVRFHRANNGISSGHGIVLMGYITGGTIRNVTGKGSKKMHSSGMTMHWSGKGGPYGSTVTETYHVGNVEVYDFDGEMGLSALGLSSTYNVKIFGSVGCNGCQEAFQWLPGDEGNRLAIAAHADFVGKGNYIENIDISGLASDADPAIGIFANAGSPWAFFPSPDGGVQLQTQYYTELHIGSITGRLATPQFRELMDVSKWYGHLRIGTIDVGDSFTDSIVDLSFCDGVTIDAINADGTFTSGGGIIQVSESRNVKINGGMIKNSNFAATGQRGFFCATVAGSATLSANAAQGATQIFVTGSVGSDVNMGSPILVNGHLVHTTAYVESACTRIPCTELPAAVTSGQTVSIPNINEFDVTLDIVGSYTAAEFENCRGRFSGSVQRFGNIGIRADTNSIMQFDNIHSIGGGLSRIANASLGTAEIFVVPTAIATCINCTFGIDAEFIEYNFETNTAGNVRRLLMIGCRVLEQGIVGYIDYNNRTDYEFIGCVGENGALLNTGGDSGSDANGNWFYHSSGVLEQWRRNVATDANGEITWTFSKPFLATGTTCVTASSANASSEARMVGAIAASTTTANIKVWNAEGVAVGANAGVNMHAIGFWK